MTVISQLNLKNHQNFHKNAKSNLKLTKKRQNSISWQIITECFNFQKNVKAKKWWQPQQWRPRRGHSPKCFTAKQCLESRDLGPVFPMLDGPKSKILYLRSVLMLWSTKMCRKFRPISLWGPMTGCRLSASDCIFWSPKAAMANISFLICCGLKTSYLTLNSLNVNQDDSVSCRVNSRQKRQNRRNWQDREYWQKSMKSMESTVLT